MKEKAPSSLVALKGEMLGAAEKDADAQAAAVKAYEARIAGIVSDVERCEAAAESRALALADLTGTAIFWSVPAQGEAADEVALKVMLINRLTDAVVGTVRTEGAGAGAEQGFELHTYRPATIGITCRVASPVGPTTVTTNIELTWRGRKIAVPRVQTVANSWIPRWQVLGALANPGGATAEVRHAIETEAIDLAKQYAGIGGKVGWRKVERSKDAPVLAEFALDFNELLGAQQNAAAYALTWIESAVAQDAVLALGSDDGVMVWVNDEQVHKNLVARSYAAQSDRVTIHLKQGRNKVLVKITQGNGAWKFGAQLFGLDGTYLPGVKCTLE